MQLSPSKIQKQAWINLELTLLAMVAGLGFDYIGWQSATKIALLFGAPACFFGVLFLQLAACFEDARTVEPPRDNA